EMNMKSKKPLLLFVTVGFAAAAGCRLAPPMSVAEGDGGALMCSEDPTFDVNAGTGGDPDGGVPIDNVVPAVSCSDTTGPTVALKYVQPYVPEPALKTLVDMTAATMS